MALQLGNARQVSVTFLYIGGLLFDHQVRRRDGDTDVELGDRDFEAEIGDAAAIVLHVHDEARLLKVPLPADAMDGDALLLEALHQLEDGVAFAADAFGAVVVVVELGVRVGLMRELERERDVVGADGGEPGRLAKLAGRVIDGFVDDVPGDDAPLVAAHDRRDVLLEDGDGVFAGLQRPDEPARILVVPDEGVAAHFHAVGFGEVDDPVGVVEVIELPREVEAFPFEGIFTHEHAELAAQDFGVLRLAIERADSHRGADIDAARFRQGTERQILRESRWDGSKSQTGQRDRS